MIKYRIKQYPEDKFIVQYREWWYPFWTQTRQEKPVRTGDDFYYPRESFANLAQAKYAINKHQETDAYYAFKPVYYDEDGNASN